MSVRHSLLALLAAEPAHGYGLKASFEERTAGAWPLNVGQVYTTLARLERDGLVEQTPPPGDGDPDPSARQGWRITDAGRAALESWYAEPVAGDPPPRDELAIKVLLAVAADGVDVSAVLQRQRTATLERLQEYTRLKAKADPERELTWLLLLDALILKAKAEVDWLDLCEERLRGRSA
jgi:DNA-binding PadR family transcriptional regulator